MSLPDGTRRRYYAFGPFALDPVRRLLWRAGLPVALTSRAFDLLVLLVEHRHQVVDKDVLLSAIWVDTVVEEATVVRHISTLRKALHQRPTEHDVLVTIPGRGYRFVAEVTELDELPTGLSTVQPLAAATNGHGLPVDHGDQPAARQDDIPAGPLADWPAAENVVSSDLPSGETSAKRTPWWPRAATLALSLGSAAAVLATTLWAVGVTQRPAGPFERQLRQFTFDAGVPRDPTWSPDGRSLAYTSDRGGNPDIWVQSVQHPNPVRLTSWPGADWQPDWSADGRWLVFRSERDGGGLFVIPSGGGPEQRITSFGYGPKWSPDGTTILFSSSPLRTNETPRLYLTGRQEGSVRSVRADLTQGFRTLHAGWHPDGRISIWGLHRETGWMFITAPPTSGSAVVSSLPPGLQEGAAPDLTLGKFAWSPKGEYVYFQGTSEGARNLWRVPVDRRSLAWATEPERLTTSAAPETEIAVSKDGSRLAFRAYAEQTRFWSFPLDRRGTVSGDGEPLTSGEGRELQPDVSAAGDKLVYQAVRGAHRELRELSLIDRREQVLVSGTDRIEQAVWSPDGSRLAYMRRPGDGRTSSSAPATSEFVVLRASGTVEARYALPQQAHSVLNAQDWAPDGRLILGGCRPEASRTLAVCSLDVRDPTAEPAVIASHPELNTFQQRFSPDSRWIAFMAVNPAEAGASTVYVVPAGGGAWTAITDGRAFDDKPRWSPDGRTVYYLSNSGAFFNVWGRHFDPIAGQALGAPFRVTSFNSPRQMISPDNITRLGIAVGSDRLVLPITEAAGELWVLESVNR